MNINGKEYITGLCRNDPHTTVAHLYEGPVRDPGNPMCVRGWNRGGGFSYSIFRNNEGEKGVCAICIRRALKGLPSVPPRTRKTKWL